MKNAGQRVLIVDDEAALRKALRTSLSAMGFAVGEARSGEEALEIFGRFRGDAVLLDINMPGMSGVETCRRLRALNSGVVIVMVTVRDTVDDIVQALEAGADDFATKPYRFRELVARLRAVLRRAQMADEEAGQVFRAGELELDLEKRTWTVPARRTKNRKPHTVHLSDLTIEIIERLPQIGASDLLFTTNETTPASGFSKAKDRLDTLMRDPPEWILLHRDPGAWCCHTWYLLEWLQLDGYLATCYVRHKEFCNFTLYHLVRPHAPLTVLPKR